MTGRIVVRYEVRNDGPGPARIGCIVTAVDGAGDTTSDFAVTGTVDPGRSRRAVAYLRIQGRGSFEVRDVTVANCTRAPDGHGPPGPED
jgi:hypothetical protein